MTQLLVTGFLLFILDLIYSKIAKQYNIDITSALDNTVSVNLLIYGTLTIILYFSVIRIGAPPLVALIVGILIYSLYENITHQIRVNIFPLSLHTGKWTQKRAVTNIINGGIVFYFTTFLQSRLGLVK